MRTEKAKMPFHGHEFRLRGGSPTGQGRSSAVSQNRPTLYVPSSQHRLGKEKTEPGRETAATAAETPRRAGTPAPAHPSKPPKVRSAKHTETAARSMRQNPTGRQRPKRTSKECEDLQREAIRALLQDSAGGRLKLNGRRHKTASEGPTSSRNEDWKGRRGGHGFGGLGRLRGSHQQKLI